jgi:hypothetical protein
MKHPDEGRGYYLPDYVWSAYMHNGHWSLTDRLPTDEVARTDEQKAAIRQLALDKLMNHFRHG